MGTRKRHQPKKLPRKLLTIRNRLGLSQRELVEKLDCEEVIVYRADISNFESGKREPPLLILLRYSRLGKVPVESLIDDDIDLTD